MSLSKTELRLISIELILLFGTEIPKDDLIKNVSNIMINKQVKTSRQILSLIKNEEEIDS